MRSLFKRIGLQLFLLPVLLLIPATLCGQPEQQQSQQPDKQQSLQPQQQPSQQQGLNEGQKQSQQTAQQPDQQQSLQTVQPQSQQTAQQPDSIPCYTQEQIELGEIATFRDNWIPKKYLPLPEYLVYADLGMLLLIMLAGLFFVLRKNASKRLGWLALITLLYLGIIRGGCICPTGLTTNMVMSILSPYHIGLVGLVMFLAPLIIALVAGRVFCTSGCPLGAIQHLIYKKKKPLRIPERINRYLFLVPLLVLVATVYFAVRGTLFVVCELDPYKPVFFTGKAWFEQGVAAMIGQPMEPRFLFSFGIFGWGFLLTMLVLGYWVQRPFCRLLCPYSAMLGVVSVLAFRRRRIDEVNCNFCRRCVKSCPTQAIHINKKAGIRSLSNYNCIQCNRCNDSCKQSAIVI